MRGTAYIGDGGRTIYRIIYWEGEQEIGSNIAELEGDKGDVVPFP